MNKWIKESLKGLVAIVVTVIVTKLLSGEPLTGLMKLKGLGHVLLKSTVPAWTFAAVLFVALFGLYEFVGRFLNGRQPKGKVHFVSDVHNSGWVGNDQRTDFRAGGIFTYEGNGSLLITTAFLEGTNPTNDMKVQIQTADGLGQTLWLNSLELQAHIPLRAIIHLWLTPMKTDRGVPLRTNLILRDNYNRDHEISGVEWPWIGGPV